MPLNSEQLAAVALRQGPVNLVAIPGSGKTKVFSERAKALIAEVGPRNFLGVTFTKSAAEEFEKRSGYRPDPDAGRPRVFRTFHGFALDVATKERLNFPFTVSPRPLLLPHDKHKVLGPVLKQMAKHARYKDVEHYISACKRQNLSPQEAFDEADGEIGRDFALAYERYESKCRELGKFDFDSLLIHTVKLFEDRPDILARWTPRYLQCDEAQDNDALQWRLVEMLASKGNVFVVGDPNQNMYTWRGSDAAGLTEKFTQRWPGAKMLNLSINYRSTGAIVDYLKEIAPIKTDAVMNMTSARQYGEKPTFKKYASETQEAEMILMGLTDPENTAILARTNRQLGEFEKAAGALNLKYKLLGRSGFFSQPEVEFTLAFAQYCAGAATDDTIKKIIRSPFDVVRFLKKHETLERLEEIQRGSVGRAPYARILREYTGENEGIVHELHRQLNDARLAIPGKCTQDALRNLITRFGILHHYEDDADADNNPADNVMSLLRMAEKKNTLLEFVQMCHRAKQASRSTAKRLTFSTVHQSKGLEWKWVYVIGVNTDVLPHKNGDLEEEKRIYYVACSRAEDRLQVSANDVASPFIKGVLPAHLEQDVEVDMLHTLYQNAAAGSL